MITSYNKFFQITEEFTAYQWFAVSNILITILMLYKQYFFLTKFHKKFNPPFYDATA